MPFFLLLILHCPNFWKWFVVPGLLYLCERFYRFSLMRSEHGKTYISSGLLLPSKVTHLVIKRPPHFDFHPGDYVFVNIPAIAKYEWHPFTISSAPEQEGKCLYCFWLLFDKLSSAYNVFHTVVFRLHVVAHSRRWRMDESVVLVFRRRTAEITFAQRGALHVRIGR